MSTLPLQHEENRALSERLRVVEKTLSMDKKKDNSVIRSEQEAEAEEPPFLLKQLSLLQCKLENSQREKIDLERQMKIYKEETQQVNLLHFICQTSLSANDTGLVEAHISVHYTVTIQKNVV